MSKPPARPTLNIGSNFNGPSSSASSTSSISSSSSSRRKNLNLDIGSSSPSSSSRSKSPIPPLGLSIPPTTNTRPRSPAPFVFPPTPSEAEYHNTHAETDGKFNEIMNCTGKINLRGILYKTEIEELEDLGELGNGTCGHVVRMKHRPSGEILAVKQMRRSGNRDENKRIIMDLEVVLKSHDCPYIVQCLGCFVTDSDVWICMELMTTCMDKLLKNLKEPLPEYIVGKVAVATLKALHYLKESHGVIHRDVKPSNILLDDKGNVKLCDFGISGRLVDSKAKTRSAGCTAYMAPERIDPPDPSRPNYDIRADVWSLGITLVELATGKFPYGDCTTEFEVMTRILEHDPPKLPNTRNYTPEFHSFVKLCLVKNYKERPKYRLLLEHPFIKSSELKTIDICMWYDFVCGSSTPTSIIASRRQQLQSPSAASLNHYHLPSSGSSSVGRHTSRLRSSPSPSSGSSFLSLINNVPTSASNHQHRLGSVGSNTSSSSGYYSSIISPRTPIRTTPSPLSGKPSRYEEFSLPNSGGSVGRNGASHLYQSQQQHYSHRTTFDRLNSEPLPNVRSPQTPMTPHTPNPGYMNPPDPPPRANRLGSEGHSSSTSSTPTSAFNGGNNLFIHSPSVPNNFGRTSSPISPNPIDTNTLISTTSNPGNSSNVDMNNTTPTGIQPPSSQSLRRNASARSTRARNFQPESQ